MKTFILFFIALIFSTAMAEQSLTVPTVEVKKHHQHKTTTPTNAHTIVITAKEIKKSGATNLSEVLTGLAGLQINDLIGDGSRAVVSMRGFGATATQNTLILLNGMPLDNPDLSPPNLNLIPINSIKKIDIFNGSESVLFGDQAVGGVINIITKMPKKNTVYADTSAGSYDAITNQAGFQVVGHHDLYASFNAKKFDTDNYRQHNQDNNEEAYGNIGQNGKKTGWDLYYNLNHQFLDLAGALTAEQVAQNRQQAQNQINYNNNDYQTYQLNQYHFLNDTWKEKFQLMHRGLNTTGVLFTPFTSNSAENWGQLSLEGLFHRTLLTSGLSFGNANYALNSSYGPLSDADQQIALFSQANIDLTQRLKLIVGARGAALDNQLTSNTNNDADQSTAVSNIGLQYQCNPWLGLFARRAGSYRFPKADEQSFTANGAGGLKVQQGVSYELGANIDKSRLSSTASVFVLDLNNELSFNPTPLPNYPFGVNSNLDPTERLGGLLNADYKMTKKLSIGVQYTHVLPEFSSGNFAGNIVPFVSENLGSLSSDYQFLSHWQLFSKLVFIGSRFSDGDFTNTFPKMPLVTLLNLAMRYQNKHLFSVLRINNILNQLYNAYSPVSTISVIPLEQQQYFYPAPGINFSITLGVNFT